MYTVFKIIAIISILLHLVLHYMSVTDYFNRFLIAISILVLIMPKKWWALYILPMLIILAGVIAGGYLLYLKIIV